MAELIEFPRTERVVLDIRKILDAHGACHPNPEVHKSIMQEWAKFGEKYTGKRLNPKELMKDLASQMIRIIELEHEVEELKAALR